MPQREKITEKYNNALKSKDKMLISTFRLILSSIKDGDIAKRTGGKKELLNDQEIDQILRKMLKQRNESADIYKKLKPLIFAVKKSGLIVGWCCDPMHGNTVKASTGFKTRKMDDIMTEVKGFFELHNEMNTIPGGVHFEMTGQNVTECVGGVYEVNESNLADRYHTHCDPRLNATQSLELAFLVADLLSENRSVLNKRIVAVS